MRVVGLHTLGHDTGIAVFDDGQLTFALETERVTREKHDHRVDAALDCFLAFDPQGLERADMFAVSTNIRRRVVDIPELPAIEDRIRDGCLDVATRAKVRGLERPTLVVAHEASHAALAAHYAGPDLPALVLVNEGRGSFSRNALFSAEENTLRLLGSDLLPWYATGFGWSAMGWLFTGDISPSMAGTLMALGAFGEPRQRIEQQFFETPRDLQDRPRSEQRRVAERMAASGYMTDDFAARADSIATLQRLFTAEIVCLLEQHLAQGPWRSLTLAGGCALNIVTNTELRRRFPVPLHIPPAPNDAGQALGAALYCQRYYLGRPATPFSVYGNGVAQDRAEAMAVSHDTGLAIKDLSPDYLAGRLADGAVVAWHRGKGEIGPRALGHRSLLANPAITGMREKVSERIKGREWFRPLAPVMREQTFRRLYVGMEPSPYMLFNYDASQLQIPEARHVDGTARIQTLPAGAVPMLEALLSSFEKQTGVPALINTSLNLKGRAIASCYADAIADFSSSDVNLFVFDDLILERQIKVKRIKP